MCEKAAQKTWLRSCSTNFVKRNWPKFQQDEKLVEGSFSKLLTSYYRISLLFDWQTMRLISEVSYLGVSEKFQTCSDKLYECHQALFRNNMLKTRALSVLRYFPQLTQPFMWVVAYPESINPRGNVNLNRFWLILSSHSLWGKETHRSNFLTL